MSYKHFTQGAIKNLFGHLDRFAMELDVIQKMYSTSCDVVVVGSGASGMTAAINAAKIGAHVILVEKLDFVGGTSLLWHVPLIRVVCA